MNKYRAKKMEARDEAINWQVWCSEHNVSYEGLAIATAYFEKLAKRYGLTREFRENCIIG